MCYGWLPLRTPTHCACGLSFSAEHALSCPKGGLPSIIHNEIRDLTAKLLTEVCSQVATEPELQPISPEEFSLSNANTQDGARLDIVMNGFWGEDQSVHLSTFASLTYRWITVSMRRLRAPHIIDNVCHYYPFET